MNEENNKNIRKTKNIKIIVIVLLLAIAVLITLMNVIVVDKITGKTMMQAVWESFSTKNTNISDPQCGTEVNKTKININNNANKTEIK